MATFRRPWSLGLVLLGLGVVLFAAGAKLALIQRYGTDQPYADQWAAEGMYFVRGPLYYPMKVEYFLTSHGEHRPALTRLWLRVLVVANEGQWDCFAELVANLLIYAAFLAVVWRWLAALVEGAWLVAAAVIMAVMFGLPCAYENVLWGFQSCFLFLLLAGVLHITGTLYSTRPSRRWWFAQLAGLAGLFSIAAGAMSAATLLVLAGFELLRGRRNAWVWATLLANLILFGLGLWLLPEAVVPAGGRLARLGQSVVSTACLLAWPFAEIWWSLLLQAPWVILLIGAWRNPDGEHGAGDRLVGALGLWVAALAFAIGFGRLVTAETIGARYYDVLVLGLFVSVPAILRIVSRRSGWRRWLWGGLGLGWLASVAVGLWALNKPERLGPMFAYQHGLAVEQRQVIRDFLASNDPARLQDFAKTSHRFPHFQTTLDFLRDPKVPPLLPPTLTPDGHENRLSRLTRSISAHWLIVLGAGVVLMILGAFRLRSGAATEALGPGGQSLPNSPPF